MSNIILPGDSQVEQQRKLVAKQKGVDKAQVALSREEHMLKQLQFLKQERDQMMILVVAMVGAYGLRGKAGVAKADVDGARNFVAGGGNLNANVDAQGIMLRLIPSKAQQEAAEAQKQAKACKGNELEVEGRHDVSANANALVHPEPVASDGAAAP